MFEAARNGVIDVYLKNIQISVFNGTGGFEPSTEK